MKQISKYYLLYLLVILICTSQQKQDHNENHPIVTVYGHQWCQKSSLAFKIIDKAEKIYQKHIKFNRVIQKGQISTIIPFPRIQFTNYNPISKQTYIYQNQLTLIQLQYFMKLCLMRQLPKCTKYSSKKVFNFNPMFTNDSNNKQQLNKLIRWLLYHPIIKVCLNEHLQPQSIPATMKVLEGLLQLPYFTKFTHNIRNQLLLPSIKQQQNNNNNIINTPLLCILMIYPKQYKPNKANQYHKIKQFSNLITLLQKRSNKLNYHIKQEDRKRVIFVSDSSNSKIIIKLMKFLQIECHNNNQDKCDNYDCYEGVYAFGFIDGRIWSRKLHLDNKFNHFIFQIQQLLDNIKIKDKINKQQQPCLANQLQHYYSFKNKQQIQTNVQLLAFIHRNNITQYIQIQSIPKYWHNGDQFRLCIKDRQAMHFNTLLQVKEVIINIFALNNNIDNIIKEEEGGQQINRDNDL